MKMRIPNKPPDWEKLFSTIINDPDQTRRALRTPTRETETYLHWDDLRYREPPADMTREEWWFALKLSRLQAARLIKNLTDVSSHPCGIRYLPSVCVSPMKSPGRQAARSPKTAR
ncbi:MAG: hypothetical protein GX875_01935 [Propionibacterium sp.]|nr:hypothetical protein [Propionibacterium sp.]